MKILQDIYAEKIVSNYDQLEDDTFKEELKSFVGQKLSKNDILHTYEIGRIGYENFV